MPKKKNKIDGKFVAITWEMLESEAFGALNGMTIKVLLWCLRKVKTYNPHERYNTSFCFTYPEAKRTMGMGDKTFWRAMKELHVTGFIEVVHRGGKRGFTRNEKSIYRLSRRWKTYGTDQFQARHPGYAEDVHGI